MNHERMLFQELIKWKEKSTRKPLIIRGARQVGKTTLVKDFAKTYENAVLLNLEKNEDISFFEQTDSIQDIMDLILLTKNIQINHKSPIFLFIDEIQESPRAIKLLRYFYEEAPSIHVIAAGSLLEFAFKDIESFPVGRVEYLYLYPFNFIEFLGAINHQIGLNAMNEIPLRPIAHTPLLELFNKFTIIGGMPEIVKEFAKNQQVSSLTSIYESIWTSYIDDVEKYAVTPSMKQIIKFIMKTAPNFIDQRIKYQNFGNSNYKSREVSEAFRDLDKSKVIRLIYPTTSQTPPILSDFKKSPRIQVLDTGIVNHSLGIIPELLKMDDLSSSYKGSLIPHMINQELISLQNKKTETPSFWVRDKAQSSSEVDLIISFQNKLIPVEIKSGSTGSLKSLHQFVNMSNHPYAVRMYGGNFEIQKTKTPEGKSYVLMNLPYFLATKLEDYLLYFLENHPENEIS